ncbi:hypothetical protein GQ457_13G009070 [Hibiscus cannabinus]
MHNIAIKLEDNSTVNVIYHNVSKFIVARHGFDNSFRVEVAGFSGGDFNATLYASDRNGFASSTSHNTDFHNTIFDCGIHDMDFHGPSFTWFKGNRVVRLDKALCNDN